MIAVQKGNPHNITSVDDFARPGLKIALGGVNSTSIGGAGDKLFRAHGIRDAVEANVVLRAPTINEVVVAMNMGTADAALLTLDQINPPEKMDAIDLPQEDNLALIVPIGATTFTTQPDAAQAFVEFVTSDEGKAIFAKHGSRPTPPTRRTQGSNHERCRVPPLQGHRDRPDTVLRSGRHPPDPGGLLHRPRDGGGLP